MIADPGPAQKRSFLIARGGRRSRSGSRWLQGFQGLKAEEQEHGASDGARKSSGEPIWQSEGPVRAPLGGNHTGPLHGFFFETCAR